MKNEAEREQRRFFVESDGEVTESVGLSCAPADSGFWFFPTLGFSVSEGFGAYEKRSQAVEAARKRCQSEISKWRQRLAEFE
jgi:hypothetical protein